MIVLEILFFLLGTIFLVVGAVVCIVLAFNWESYKKHTTDIGQYRRSGSKSAKNIIYKEHISYLWGVHSLLDKGEVAEAQSRIELLCFSMQKSLEE